MFVSYTIHMLYHTPHDLSRISTGRSSWYAMAGRAHTVAKRVLAMGYESSRRNLLPSSDAWVPEPLPLPPPGSRAPPGLRSVTGPGST